tara:strand:- start:1148 stop:1330 length:183 start_codon:yes stop_codon:yes gene_type:complete
LKSKDKINYFEGFDDSVLIEMILYYPEAFKKMLVLVSLDIQLEKESYEKVKSSSSRRDVC